MSTNAIGPLTSISTAGEANSLTERILRLAWRVGILLMLGAMVFLAWLVRTAGLYEAGSDFGYNLGLVGGLLMLSLLLYTVRKRFLSFDRFGKMENWFKYHMLAGIVGPLLVLFHSTFRTGSMNGAAALYAMVLVAVSGLVGRFIYRHIHRGMYGKHLTLAEAIADVDQCAAAMGLVYSLREDIQTRLQVFHDYAFDPQGSLHRRVWKFVTLNWKSKFLARTIRFDAKTALRKLWGERGGSRRELILNYQLARAQIDQYLEAVVKASQLTAWERLFSYWHLIHVPFLYLLVFSGIVHVIAVHMY